MVKFWVRGVRGFVTSNRKFNLDNFGWGPWGIIVDTHRRVDCER